MRPDEFQPISPDAAANTPTERRLLYVPVRAKFTIALLFAIAWLLFSIWVSQAWLRDLSALTHPVLALIALSFIAYVPGFMNAFLIFSLLQDNRPRRRPLPAYPSLTLLIAAYNEEGAIAETLRSIVASAYPGVLEVLVLNDGSRDDTLGAAQRALGALRLVDTMSVRILDFPQNRGKAAVLNRGLAEASHELIVTIDADTHLRANSITHLVERMASDPPGTCAVAGALLVANPRETLMAGMQAWDYAHGIAAVKRMQSMYHGALVAQGAFSIYRRECLRHVGGWPECVGEDIVLTWALLRQGYRTGYAEDAVAFTVAPTTLRQFAHQRRRWARGMVEALKHHEGLLLRGRLSTMFVWWNFLFMPMDLIFTFVFIPGVILALFGHYWLAGPLTLLTLPLAALWNLVIGRIQQRMFDREELDLARNYPAFLPYVFGYSLIMQPVSLWGYASELIGSKKKWGTK